ncbi:MAG: pseudouridine synthase [Terracidiphilus sp.]
MNDKKKSRSAAPKTKRVSGTKKSDEPVKKPATKIRKAGTKSTAAVVKTRKAKAEAVAAPAAKRASKTRTAAGRTREPAAKKKMSKVKAGAGIEIGKPVIVEPVLDQIGDVISGESMMYLGEAEPAAQVGMPELDETTETAGLTAAEGEASAGEAAGGVDLDEAERKTSRESHPPANLERLQKILSQAGIASRRHAEEMIVAGHVMVNGQVVTTLGSKADPARDHIRVDGKLLQGAERHRYFVLNKPKGYVTTVSDPEGRATVMEFFARMPERLYPVGRLDYQSEGLLLMTNDGELANLLTKAGSGVEKTYLVKVAGQPTEEELERLRGGVAIERGEAGSERVRTAPARVRQVREGDNPWYEVVLIEGRNRELRKMFSAVGHFVEKIRRVGYGPLVLDVEPGKLRELSLEEVKALRLTAEGKLKPKRMKVERIPPAKAGRAAEKRVERGGSREERPRRQRDDRPPQSSGARIEAPRWKQEERGPKREWQPRSEGFRSEPKARPEFRSAPRREGGENRFGSAPRAPFKPRGDRPEFRSAPRQDRGENRFGGAPRAPFKPRGDRPEFRPPPRPEGSENRSGSAPRAPFNPRGDRPQFRPPPRPEGSENRSGGAPRAPFKPRGDRPEFRPAPRQDRGEKRFGSAPRALFKPRTDRPQWKRDDTAKPPFQVERIDGPDKTASFGGGRPKPSFGAKPGLSNKPGGFGKYRGNTRGGPKRGFSRPGAPRGGRKRG